MGRTVPLAQRLQDDGAGGHVDAQRQGLGGVDDLDQARTEEFLHRLLEHRQQPRVVGRNTTLQGVGPEVEAEDPQVAGGDVSGTSLDDLPDPCRLGLGGQVHPGADHLVDGLLAARPGEDEDDRGQQAGPLQGRDDLQSRGRLQPGRAGSPLAAARRSSASGGALPGLRPSGRTTTAAAVAVLRCATGGGGTPGLLDGLEQLWVERGLLPRLLGHFRLVELVGLLRRIRGAGVQRQQPATDHHVLSQRDGALLGDDDGGPAAHLAEPVAELLGVGDRGGQGDHLDLGGQVDDDLLPHRPAEAVGQVVDLVHDHEAQSVQVSRARVEHVAQHLGGHDHHVRMRVDGGVTGQQPHPLLTVPGHEVQVLLVAQRLDGGGVEGLESPGQAQVHGELPHHCLAGARRGGDQDALSSLDGAAGLLLEGVEGKVVALGESDELTAGGGLSTSRCGIALCW